MRGKVHIEIHGPQAMLDEYGRRLKNELNNAGFSDGPKVNSADRKVIGFTKGDSILNIEISHESEAREACLSVECENPVPEFEKIWDAALIAYGKEIIKRLQDFAIDKEKVKKEF